MVDFANQEEQPILNIVTKTTFIFSSLTSKKTYIKQRTDNYLEEMYGPVSYESIPNRRAARRR